MKNLQELVEDMVAAVRRELLAELTANLNGAAPRKRGRPRKARCDTDAPRYAVSGVGMGCDPSAVLSFVRKNPACTGSAVYAELGDGARNVLRDLCKERKVRRKGEKRAARYTVK